MAILSACLLFAFALLIILGSFLVLRNSLENHQLGILQSDAARVETLFNEGKAGSSGISQQQGGIKISIYDLDGQFFDGVPLGVDANNRIFKTTESKVWEGIINRAPHQAIVKPIDIKIGALSPVKKFLIVSTDVSYIRSAVTAVSGTAGASTLFLMVLALAGGYWVSVFGLKPLVKVVRQAKRLNERNLKPLEFDGPKDELGLLVNTLNQMVERLAKAFASQRVFLAETSHELRTPLTSLEGYLYRALREAGPEQRPVLENALRVAQTMSRLVADLLQLSRGEVIQDLIPHVVDLAEIAELVGNEFGLECNCDSAEIVGDPDRLTQLTRNLVANAVRASQQHIGQQKVEIQVESKKDKVVLHVIDHGPGIPADVLPHIFEKFYRGPQGGSGLGLAIVAQIARLHKAEIRVESRLGIGTHFFVVFPAYSDEI